MLAKTWSHEVRAFTRYRSVDGTEGATNATAGITFKNGLYVGGSLNTAGLPLSTDNITILGEDGNGYLAFGAQSVAPTQALAHIYADAGGKIVFGASGSQLHGIAFDSQLLSAPRIYAAPNKSGTFAMTDDNVSQFVNDSGYITPVALANYVQGPVSSITGSLPSFSNTTGKYLQDSGIGAATVVVGPSSAVSGQLPMFSGTSGKLVSDSGVAITGTGIISLGGFNFTIPATGTAVLTARALTAGAGLTGGGDLSADRTFAVGAGAGLTVNADDVALTTPGTLTIATGNASAGSHTHAITSSSNPGVAASLLATDASGHLILQNLSLAGTQFLPVTTFHTDIGQMSKKFREIHGAELHVETLVAQESQATIGGRILVGPTTSLIADALAAATTIDVKHNQLANGDRLYFEDDGKVEFMAVTSGPTTITGGYRYSVTRNLDGTGANDWFAGDAVFNTGQTGDGFIDLYSRHGVKSTSEVGPTIVGNVRHSATYNDWAAHWAIGNLEGLYGYTSPTFGVALGMDGGTDFITVDPTDGLIIRSGGGSVQLDGNGLILSVDPSAISDQIQWHRSGTSDPIALLIAYNVVTGTREAGFSHQARVPSNDSTSRAASMLQAFNDDSLATASVKAVAVGSTASVNATKSYVLVSGSNFLGMSIGSNNAPAHMLDTYGEGWFQTGVALRDSSAAFDVNIRGTSSTALTANRILTLDVSNAARTLKLTGNPTLADWFDQSVKTTDSPTFANGVFTGTGSFAGTTLTVGPGGSGASVAKIIASGGSTGAGGGIFEIFANGSSKGGYSVESVIQGSGSNSKITLYSSTSTYRVWGLGAGTLTTDASGNLVVTSDERQKDIEGNFERGLEALRKIQPILYHNKSKTDFDTEHLYAGFGARNVRKAIPEAVFGKKTLSLQDRPIIAALVNAVKELEDQIADLRGQLKL